MLSNRRPAPLIAAAAALLAAAVLLALLLASGGGDDNDPQQPRRAPASADPLTFVPESADAIFDIDLRVPLAAVAFRELLPRAARDVPNRGRAAVALRGSRRWLAFQTPEAEAIARRANAAAPVSARRGVVLVAPPGAGTRLPPLTRRAFEQRVARLPRRAGVRVAFRPQALLARFGTGVAGTRWARSLRSGAAAVVVRGNAVVVPVRLDGSPPPADAVPIAPGATPPQPRGRAPIVVGLKDPARALRFAREAGLLPELDVSDSLPGFLAPDLARLGPEGTLTSDGRGTVTVRVVPADPGDWRRKLDRLDALSGLGRTLGIADVRIDRRDGAYRIETAGRFALRIGIYGDALVLSTNERADLAAAARAPATPAPPDAQGALAGSIAPEVLFDVLAARFGTEIPRNVVTVSPLTGWLRAEPGGLAGQLVLSVSR